MPIFFKLNLTSAKVAREIYFYFTYSIDVNVTLHTFKLKMAVEYEIVIKFAVNFVPRVVRNPVTSLCLPVDEGLFSIYLQRA